MQPDKHTLKLAHSRVGCLAKGFLANVKNKISTRVGKQNNLINEITFLEDVLVRG